MTADSRARLQMHHYRYSMSFLRLGVGVGMRPSGRWPAQPPLPVLWSGRLWGACLSLSSCPPLFSALPAILSKYVGMAFVYLSCATFCHNCRQLTLYNSLHAFVHVVACTGPRTVRPDGQRRLPPPSRTCSRILFALHGIKGSADLAACWMSRR